ncbi:SMI1/KNR4 family protein [Planotetraspora sp. GP83]|uniref:SMI1/KNR4 family protein n=1 Tax=Planotetraspora sp. GP83 TaxID=3156264 RepID=UPI003516E884
MRRLITSHPVRLALAAALACAAGVALGVALMRRRTASRPAAGFRGAAVVRPRGLPEQPGHDHQAEQDTARQAEPGTTPPEPPEPYAEPVLGRPTAEDLKRYDRPEGGALIARLVAARAGREPFSERFAALDATTRRRTIRWAQVAVALGVLFLASQALDSATFGGDSMSWLGLGTGPESSYPDSPESEAESSEDAYYGYDLPGRSAYAGNCGDPAAGLCDDMDDDMGDDMGDDIGEDGDSGGWSLSGPEPIPFSHAGMPDPAESGDPDEAGLTGAAASPSPSVEMARPDPGCEPRGAGKKPVVRPIDPHVTAAVNRQWRRIEKWLKAHAPVTYRRLTRPASARMIAKVEAKTGMRVPDSLRASLLRHDGGPSGSGLELPPFYTMVGVADIADSWDTSCQLGGGWVPFAVSGDGGFLFADSRTGEIGEYFPEDGRPTQAQWPSYYRMLKTIADALVTGAPVLYGSTPTVTDGSLSWNLPEE